MITLIRKAISETIGIAWMPVSYIWRVMDATRRCRGRSERTAGHGDAPQVADCVDRLVQLLHRTAADPGDRVVP